MDFHKHQAVLRKLIHSMYKSVGSVFQAWKMFTRTKKEEMLGKKAAKITSRILALRGQCRMTFVSWVRFTLAAKVERYRYNGNETQFLFRIR